MNRLFTLWLAALCCLSAAARRTYNFNMGWLMQVGDTCGEWQRVTLPHAFNEDEAFRLPIDQHTDTVVWYRKHFRLPRRERDGKVWVELEGARQGADFWLNGHYLGFHENGVMAVGLDLTPYLNRKGDNVMTVRADNSWRYRERTSNSRYQWNDKNFNANYGGLPKNVWLHTSGRVYQTLPLYSNLGTTGVYIYATDHDVPGRSAAVHAEAQVRNEGDGPADTELRVVARDADGKVVGRWSGERLTIDPGQTATLRAEQRLDGLHWWSWGYGYLYRVATQLWVGGRMVDEVVTTTGFRHTEFGGGLIKLNGRTLMMHGYAQRTSNEWPAVGMSVPAWLSDYSNGLMVQGGANLVRWMHVTPWRQDVESCDRVGLIQAMPAGDSERDVEGERWRQRTELMRDAIIYNRNSPSILFYECGNESISREHMLEMKALRDSLDPHGGRAIGSREMLDIREAEYGGEMLYINKSAHHPMWAMEYCRDEGLRKYWDGWSYPYHQQGEGNDSYHSTVTGTTAKRADARAYNQNQDSLAIEHVRRWHDYYVERPGTGDRVSSGGAKIIFSDTNTHYRGVENYRRSGSVDAMRIAKDSWFAHRVMWDGWVEPERERTYIIGHWNYPDGTVKPVNVVSTSDSVELILNGRSLGYGERKWSFLHSWPQVAYEPGTLVAVGSESADTLMTAGTPAALRLTAIENPQGWHADGADMLLVEAEVVDAEGRRCPLANDMLHFALDGPAEWRGGIAQGPDNCILSRDLPVECGVNRALLRSTERAGRVTLTATADGLPPATLTLRTLPVTDKDGLSDYIPRDWLAGRLDRGETPAGESFTVIRHDIPILSATAVTNAEDVAKSYDDTEVSEWRNDGRASTAWIEYTLEPGHRLDEVCMKLTGWRNRSYPLDIYADTTLVWSGETERTLGYVHLPVRPTVASRVTICLRGTVSNGDAFGDIVELVEPVGGELDLFKAEGGDRVGHELRIVEVEFKTIVCPPEGVSALPGGK